MLVYLKALQYSMSESDHLNSTNNTENTFISLDQASTIMADQTQGANPQHILKKKSFCMRKNLQKLQFKLITCSQ